MLICHAGGVADSDSQTPALRARTHTPDTWKQFLQASSFSKLAHSQPRLFGQFSPCAEVWAGRFSNLGLLVRMQEL